MKRKPNNRKTGKKHAANPETHNPRKYTDDHEKKASKYGVEILMFEEELEEYEDEPEKEYR